MDVDPQELIVSHPQGSESNRCINQGKSTAGVSCGLGIFISHADGRD